MADGDDVKGQEEKAEAVPAAGDPAEESVAVEASAEESAAEGAPAEVPGEGPAGEARPEDPADADDVLTKKVEGHEAADAEVLAKSRRHTRRSFAIAAVSAAAGYGLYQWIDGAREEGMLAVPLRETLRANAAISRGVFDERAMAPTYPLAKAESLRVNGVYGLKRALVPESWRLQVVGVRDAERSARWSKDVTAWEYRYTEAVKGEDQGHDTKVAPGKEGPGKETFGAGAAGQDRMPEGADTATKMAPAAMVEKERAREQRTGRRPRGREEAGESASTLDAGTGGLLLTMEDLHKLPRQELVTQFKCIEGWSQIVHWAGVRMADFLEAYPPAGAGGKEPRYVYMETPDGDYYTGYDMGVCRHPQTLLVMEMMGEPLTQFHGAPLRLHMPTKYGYKQIKRIGLIQYSDTKPDDYWTKLGYDWYAGL